MPVGRNPWWSHIFAPHLSSWPGSVNLPHRDIPPIENSSRLMMEPEQFFGGGSQREERPFYHKPVMLDEVLHFLAPTKGDLIVDGTLGGGGHSEKILEEGASVLGLDKDQEAIDYASLRLAGHGDRFAPIQSDFRELGEILEKVGIPRVQGILVDLGVSSRQLDEGERGFSFQSEGPLDMRMDRSRGETAADLINTMREEQLADCFWRYGEERASRRIAKAIATARTQVRIKTTAQLASIVEGAKPRAGRKHPATKVFQALRIAVNDELGAIESLLEQSARWLRPGGRLVVITFHSLEDRIVKNFMRERSREWLDQPGWPEPRRNPDYTFKRTIKKALDPSPEEIKTNPRARSAKLRVAERLQI